MCKERIFYKNLLKNLAGWNLELQLFNQEHIQASREKPRFFYLVLLYYFDCFLFLFIIGVGGIEYLRYCGPSNQGKFIAFQALFRAALNEANFTKTLASLTLMVFVKEINFCRKMNKKIELDSFDLSWFNFYEQCYDFWFFDFVANTLSFTRGISLPKSLVHLWQKSFCFQEKSTKNP